MGDTTNVALPELPKGITTSEFWVSAATTAIAVLTGLGVLHPDFAQRYQEQIAHVAWLAAIVVPGAYSVARSIAKHGHQRAVAEVLKATIEAGRTVEAVAEAEQLRDRPRKRPAKTKAPEHGQARAEAWTATALLNRGLHPTLLRPRTLLDALLPRSQVRHDCGECPSPSVGRSRSVPRQGRLSTDQD